MLTIKKYIKLLTLGLSLAILSLGGSFLISAVLAWTGPGSPPPSGNVSTLVTTNSNASLANLTLTGSNSYLNQTANARYYIDSKKGFQIRLDSDNNDANADFAINNSANQEVFKIDENGMITAKSNYLPRDNKHLATKDYVDAFAAGGGDATLANQEAMINNQLGIMGSNFDQSLDSLKIISDKLGKTSDSPTLGSSIFAAIGFLANKTIELQGIVQNYSIQVGEYFENGGNPYYCRKKTISSGGQVSYTNINNNLQCDTGMVCSSGICGGSLTFGGSSHLQTDCLALGGTVFNTGSGTACKFSSANCPSGWTQASSWQRYEYSPWQGDHCGRHKGYGPTSFSNSTSYDAEKIRDSLVELREGHICEGYENYWCLHTYCYTPYYHACTQILNFNEWSNSSRFRIEIGCY